MQQTFSLPFFLTKKKKNWILQKEHYLFCQKKRKGLGLEHYDN